MTQSSFASEVKGLIQELVQIFLSAPNPNDEKQALLEITPKIAEFSDSNTWRYKYQAYGATSGFLSGATGGPWGIGMTIADLFALRRFLLRGVVGIGLLENKKVDLKIDLPAITMLWSGKMSIINATEYAGTKVAVKIGQKAGVKSMTIVVEAGSKILAKAAGKVAVKFGNKSLAKTLPLVVSPLVTKAASKLTAKQLFSWIPVIGGAVSGAVNIWIIRDFLKNAQDYYKNEDFFIDKDLVDAFSNDGVIEDEG